MRIIVALKQVASRESNLLIKKNEERLDDSGFSYELNGPDAYALESALQLRDSLGSEVVVLAAGPDRVTKTIREALAKGADRGLHVLTSADQALDPFELAHHIAQATRAETPDLFLTGLQSEDSGYGETGVIVAELLGYSHATLVTEIQVSENRLRVRKELEDGWSQYVTLPMPAMLSIQSSHAKPRLATMLGIRQAKTKRVDVVPLHANSTRASVGQHVERIVRPAKREGAQIFTGDPREAARQFIEQLRSRAAVL